MTKFSSRSKQKVIFYFTFHLIWQLVVFESLKLDDFSSTVAKFWFKYNLLLLCFREFFSECIYSHVFVIQYRWKDCYLFVLWRWYSAHLSFLDSYYYYHLICVTLNKSHNLSLLWIYYICKITMRKLIRWLDIFSGHLALEIIRFEKILELATYTHSMYFVFQPFIELFLQWWRA